MRVFVTGGSGFVGGHLIEALVARGHAVFALARSEKAAATVRRYGAEAVSGDLGALRDGALRGVDAVVHAAAFVEEWGTRQQFWDANVDGTARMLDAARRSGVGRFVHVGTEAAVFAGRDLVDVDESTPYPVSHRYLYSETKAEAERRVLAASTDGFVTTSIRPRLVWGPRDTSVLPAVLRMDREGSFAWLDGGRAMTSTTHVDNLVDALATVLLTDVEPIRGRAFFVADDGTRSVREFLTRLARTAGVELGAKTVPSFVARPLAHVLELVWRAAGAKKPPPMTRFAIDMMSSTVTVSTKRAVEAFGYAPVVSVDEGLARMSAP